MLSFAGQIIVMGITLLFTVNSIILLGKYFNIRPMNKLYDKFKEDNPFYVFLSVAFGIGFVLVVIGLIASAPVVIVFGIFSATCGLLLFSLGLILDLSINIGIKLKKFHEKQLQRDVK